MNLVLLNAQVALFCVVLLMLGYGVRHERRTKKLQQALLDELKPELAQRRWFRINLSGQPFFERRMKLLGYESKGLLIDQGDHLRIVAVQLDGQRIEHAVPKAPGAIRWLGNMTLGASNLHWLAASDGSHTVMISADTGMNALASREATADMVRAVLPEQSLDPSALQEFALEKNQATRIAVVLLLAILMLTLFDMTVSEHQLLKPRSLYPIGVVVGLLGLLAYPLLTRRKVPAREAMFLSAMLCAVLGGGFTSAALRLDQGLSGGPVATPYRLVSGARLEPLEPGPPEVTLNHVREYWAQFEPGSLHELDIVHGPLGIWQLDRSRLNALTRAWYRREDEPTPAASRPASTAPTPPR
jgi:hypothetical protein